jgi:hypothetical protein
VIDHLHALTPLFPEEEPTVPIEYLAEGRKEESFSLSGIEL